MALFLLENSIFRKGTDKNFNFSFKVFERSILQQVFLRML
jgi:hypothetical protein